MTSPLSGRTFAGGRGGRGGPARETRHLPLRVRLMLWMLAIFLIVQLSIAFVFRLYLARAIEDFFAERAVNRVSAIADAVRPLLPGVTDAQLEQLASARFLVRTDDAIRIDLYDRAGNPMATSDPPSVPLDAAVAQRLAAFHSPFSVPIRAKAQRGEGKVQNPKRIAIAELAGPDGRTVIIAATTSDINANRIQELTTRMIVAAIPIGLLPIALSAYLIAGIAVRPLADIRELAQRLSPESIDQSIENEPAASEVSDVRMELEMARRRIEAGFAAQERFMSNVSHELKTPIAVVLTGAQALRAEGADKPVKEFLRSMTEELEKLGRTVDNFLLLTRVRHNKGVIPAIEECALREVLLESYASCLSMASLHKVRIDLRVPEGDDIDAAVEGNTDLLRIVFDNLIRNAIRFSPEGELVSVEASATRASVEVRVRDKGPGIPPALLPRVFDRFAQSKDEERRGRGHGLGLEIALGIAELHRGSISVVNCEGGGCEFTVTLPRRQSGTHAAPSPRPDRSDGGMGG